MSDFHIHQQSTSNKPRRASQRHGQERRRCVSAAGKEGRAAAYLFNWDGSAAPDAVCTTLQAFLLFVWVTPFPRLQNENKVSIWPGLRLTDGTRSAHELRTFCKHVFGGQGGGMYADIGTRTTEAGCGFFRLHGCVILKREFSKLFPCKIIF